MPTGWHKNLAQIVYSILYMNQIWQGLWDSTAKITRICLDYNYKAVLRNRNHKEARNQPQGCITKQPTT